MVRKSLALVALVPLLVVFFPTMSSAYSPAVCTISGTTSSDRITGTSGDDIICAGSGNDTIYSIGGDDIVYGGPGNDRIYSGAGDDKILGDSGNDYVESGSGSDDVDGGLGNDTVSGGLGNDKLDGWAGNDTISGGTGRDLIEGDAGTDSLSGGTEADMINGGAAKDTIRTGSGLDSCSSDSSDVLLDECKIDGSAPEIGVQAAYVRNFTAGSIMKLNWSVSDSTGVDKSWGSIGGAPGWITSWCGFGIEAQRISGDEKNGTYQIECQIPDNAVNETYSLFVSASDMLGNSTPFGPQITFTISGGSSDSKAPSINKITLAPTAKPGEEITMSVSASDETGVAVIYGWFMKDGGGFASYPDIGLYVNSSTSELVSGSNKSGIFNQTHKFSDKAPAGSYTLWLSSRDELGNNTFESTDKKVTVTN
jgi:Ca2+-binding RTX toxin-like protein